MRRSELTILLPPAELKSNGEIVSRVYPLTITGTVHTPYVIVEDIHISPGNGVLDIRMTGEGVFDRRHTIGVSNTALPQAAATEMQPLEIRLLNLNPDAAVYVVLVISTVEAVGSGPPVTFGGAVRFRGTLPLGTDGKPPTDMNDRAGNKSVIADGPLWSAVLTVNDTFEVRNIRDITSQVRVLAPTGSGRIPVTGGGRRVIIVKKDGVTMEVEADTLDFRNIFELDLPSSGTVSILGLLAESIAGDVIQNGAIKSVHIEPGAIITNRLADNAVTPAKLDRSYSESGHTHDNRYYTESEVNSLLAGKSNVGHTHPPNLQVGSGGDNSTPVLLNISTGIRNVPSYEGSIQTLSADFNHVARANINNINGAFTITHQVNTVTTPRVTPGYDAYAAGGTLAVGQNVTRLGTVAVSQGGSTWWQVHHYTRGICWMVSSHLTAV